MLKKEDTFSMSDLKIYGNYLYFGIYEGGKRHYYGVNLKNKQGKHIFEIDDVDSGIYNLAI